jgi:hypothetical protein
MMEIKDYIAAKHVSGKLLSRLQALSGDDAGAVAALVEAINPSANALRGLLQLADEICLRDGVKMQQVLTVASIKAVLENDKLSRKEKQKEIRFELETVRYPVLSALRRELTQAQAELVRDTGIRLEAPVNLEGEMLFVSLSARSADEFGRLAEKLQSLALHPATKRIFELLRGE